MAATRKGNALRDVVACRRALRDARHQYHLALMIADDLGIPHDEIALALDTRPLYVTNAIRTHRVRKCGCPS